MNKSSEAFHSFLTSFIGSVAFYFVILIVLGIYSLATFNLAGGETLEEIEVMSVIKFVICLLILPILFVYTRFWKKRNKYNIMGTLLIPSVCSIVFGYFVVMNKISYEKFEQTVWIKSESKPEGMAKSLVKNKQLIGLSRQEVRNLLGEGVSENGNAQSDWVLVNYHVQNSWTLIIAFTNNKVTDVNLRQPMLLL